MTRKHGWSAWLLLLAGLLCGACQPVTFSAALNSALEAAPQERLSQRRFTTPLPFETPTAFPFTPTPSPTIVPIIAVAAVITAATDPVPVFSFVADGRVRYLAQAGDTLPIVATRFGLQAGEILSPEPMLMHGLLSPGQLLLLPPQSGTDLPFTRLLPDSEIVYGPSAADFRVGDYLEQTGGYLSTYREYLNSTGWTSAADILTRVALENSINPRVFLSLLEYACQCVVGSSTGQLESGYVLGVEDYHYPGLYGQLSWAASQLSAGYYGWRSGALTAIRLPGGIIASPAPDSNAGSVAVQYYFAALLSAHHNAPEDSLAWKQALDIQNGFPALHRRMFGEVEALDQAFGPLYPPGLQQPELRLPFLPGSQWSYSSGPHKPWESAEVLAAMDLAPASPASGCIPSDAWVTAVGDGQVVRTGQGTLLLDLFDDVAGNEQPASDGKEQTGWAILYLHIASQGSAPVGTRLHAGEPLGHPSCEGGPATGTHVHIARKYNGEWVAADGPLLFVMSGWVPHAGDRPYQGTLTKNGQTVIAHPNGAGETLISLDPLLVLATVEATDK